MRYKQFVKEVTGVFEAITVSLRLLRESDQDTRREINTLSEDLWELKQENKMFRDHLNLEIVEETVNGRTTKFLRKTK